VDFFAAFPVAVANDGKDLTRVPWQFLVEVLKKLPQQPQEIQAVIDPVISGLSLLAEGKEWSTAYGAVQDAWSNAYWATRAARNAALAACAAADARANARNNAWGDAGASDAAAACAARAGVPIEWQKELILRLIAEA
jgi:hypothetical protein